MKRIKFLIVINAFYGLNVFAQATHEISVNGGGGLSTLHYKLNAGDRSGGFGGNLGVGYTYFFDYQWGIYTGAEVGFYNSKAKLDKVKAITYNLTDIEGDRFNLHTTISGYKETQNAIFLNIPVMAHYQINEYYILGGFKIGIPLSGKFKYDKATFLNEGYYPDLNNWGKTQEFAGYGTFAGKNSEGNIKFGVSVSFALEGGMKWFISRDLMLYSGLYFDYGLNNISKKNNPFVIYSAENPENFSTNSVISSYSDDNISIKFTERTYLLSTGVKVRLAFGL